VEGGAELVGVVEVEVEVPLVEEVEVQVAGAGRLVVVDLEAAQVGVVAVESLDVVAAVERLFVVVVEERVEAK
jgi:hypothetical protein